MLKKSTRTKYNNKLWGHFISLDAFHVDHTLIWLTWYQKQPRCHMLHNGQEQSCSNIFLKFANICHQIM